MDKSLNIKNVTNIEWPFGNFNSKNTKFGVSIDSPIFSTSCSSTYSDKLVNVQWRLRLYPQGLSADYDYKQVAIRLENTSGIKVSATYEIILQSESGNIIYKSCLTKGKPGDEESWTLHHLVQTLSLEEFLFDYQQDEAEDLIVVCSISNVRMKTTGDDISEQTAYYEDLLETGKFGDVTFKIGEKEMQLHKAILSSESAVFRAMFEHEMLEQKDGVVNIVDIDFNVMKEMFRYIYTKRVANIDKFAVELFVVADRYSVEGLKLLCEKRLVDQLNKINAWSYLEFAVKYNMAHLKPEVLEFVVYELKELTKKNEFKELTSDCKDELLSYITRQTIIIDPR